MSEGQRRSAVARKRAASNVGPKPTNVKTILKRTKKAKGGPGGTTTPYFGRSIKGSYGGVELSNPSYRKYYKGMI